MLGSFGIIPTTYTRRPIAISANGMIVTIREPVRHSNCSIWDGKWKCQAMRCKAPKIVVMVGRMKKNKNSEPFDERESGA